MPYESEVLRVLLRDRRFPLNRNHWRALIDARKASMMRHIRELGQKKLGDTPHWNSRADIGGSLREAVAPDRIYSLVPGVDLSTRGVFVFCRKSAVYSEDHATMMIHGFDRTGQWLSTDTEFDLIDGKPHNKRVRITGLRPQMGVSCADDEIYLREIFEELGQVIANWAENRRELLKDAEALAHTFRLEDQLLESLNGSI